MARPVAMVGLLIIFICGCTASPKPVQLSMPDGLIGEFHSDSTIQIVNLNKPDEIVPPRRMMNISECTKYGELVCANLYRWTNQLIDIISEELNKRGVKRLPDAEKVLKIEILEINCTGRDYFSPIQAQLVFNVKIDGLVSENFIGMGKSSYSCNKAYGNAFLWSAGEVLNHPDIRKFISKP